MADESKIVESHEDVAAATADARNPSAAQVESESDDDGGDAAAVEGDDAGANQATGADAKSSTKKKSKRKRVKNAVVAAATAASTSTAGKPASREEQFSKAISGLNAEQISTLLSLNPSLAQQLGAAQGGKSSLSPQDAASALKKLGLEELMTGLAVSGKNAKDMASYKFWQTQPVPKFGETEVDVEGPYKMIDPETVDKEPGPLVEGFEWVTMDMTNEGEVKEVFELLYGHYVEDEEAMFRFNYSESFFRWALLSPGWRKDWHVGVRAAASRKLVAFISAIPVAMRVRQKVLKASEVNFLCIHKKLRSKRLAPVLIKEITRRCYREGTYQAIYTAGVVLPKPISTCRYFHRSINWQKLYEVKFSPLPKGSKPSYQVRKYALPVATSTKGLRPMKAEDIDAVLELLNAFLQKFELAPSFSREEIEHWLLHKPSVYKQQVIWAYVVEDPNTSKITDFFSFYCLESTVINSPLHNNVRAAYLYYYASTLGLPAKATDSSRAVTATTTSSSSSPSSPPPASPAYKERLNALMHDALILARRADFDVLNALTLMDNALFLEQQRFGGGDGQLHYYLYNYRANPIAGGVNGRNEISEAGSGIGLVML